MAQKNKKIDIKSTVKKSADSIKRMVNNGLSINRSYDCHYVLNEYWIAYLMSSFDKIVQSTLFDLYRITNLIENCVDGVPEEIKNNISIEIITEEYDKQYMLNDEHNVFDFDNFKSSHSNWTCDDWYKESERLNSELLELSIGIDDVGKIISKIDIEGVIDYMFKLSHLKDEGAPQRLYGEENTKFIWERLDDCSQNVIIYFYQVAPILLRYCQITIFDIYDSSKKLNKIAKDYKKLDLVSIDEIYD